MKDHGWGVIDVNLLAHLPSLKGQAVSSRVRVIDLACSHRRFSRAAGQEPRSEARTRFCTVYLGQHCTVRQLGPLHHNMC